MKRSAPVKLNFFWASMAAASVCALIVLWIVLKNIPDESFGHWPRLLLVVMLGIFVVASLATTEIIPWRSRSFREWRRPKVLGSVVLLLMGGVAFVTGLANVFAPPVATEETGKKILGTVESVNSKLAEAGVAAGQSSLIEQHIAGLWGEPGCQVTYELTLNKGLLTVNSVRSVTGQSPLHMALEAQPGRSGHLVASVLSPTEERGEQHEFVYRAAGDREFLAWMIKKRDLSLALDRCYQQ